MSEKALNQLREQFPNAVLESGEYRGDEWAIVDREMIRPIGRFLKDTNGLQFDMLTDLTAVDYFGRKTPRFEVVYHLYSVQKKHRLRLKVPLSEDDPTVDTLSDLWKVANWMEREVWDMYGIRFNDHPDPRRILLYEEFEGHPLRKDYPKDKHQPLVRRSPEAIEEALKRRPGTLAPIMPE